MVFRRMVPNVLARFSRTVTLLVVDGFQLLGYQDSRLIVSNSWVIMCLRQGSLLPIS